MHRMSGCTQCVSGGFFDAEDGDRLAINVLSTNELKWKCFFEFTY